MPYVLYLCCESPADTDVLVNFCKLRLEKEKPAALQHFLRGCLPLAPSYDGHRREAVDFSKIHLAPHETRTLQTVVSALLKVFYGAYMVQETAPQIAAECADSVHPSEGSEDFSIRVVLPSKQEGLPEKPWYRYCKTLSPIERPVQVTFDNSSYTIESTGGFLAVQFDRRLWTISEGVPLVARLWPQIVDLCFATKPRGEPEPLSARISFASTRPTGHATRRPVDKSPSNLQEEYPFAGVANRINIGNPAIGVVTSGMKWQLDAVELKYPDRKPSFCKIWYKEFPGHPAIDKFSTIDYGESCLDKYRDTFRTIAQCVPGQLEETSMHLQRVYLPHLGGRGIERLRYPSVTELQYHIFREDQLTGLRATLGHCFPGLKKLEIIIGWRSRDGYVGTEAAPGPRSSTEVLAVDTANFTLGQEDVTVLEEEVLPGTHLIPVVDSEDVWKALGPFPETENDASCGSREGRPRLIVSRV